MKQNDWLVLIAVLVLLYFLTRRKPLDEEVTSTYSFPGLNEDGTSKTRSSGGDLLSHIIELQGDTVQNF